MKKYFYTMAVIAIFAIGFAASGDSDEVMTDDGRVYHKVTYTCEMCGDSPEYAYQWKSKDGWRKDPNGISENFWAGKFYCRTCVRKVMEEKYGTGITIIHK